MQADLKQKCDDQFFEKWPEFLPKKKNGKIDWFEVIGSIIAVILIGVFAYLWFSFLPQDYR